DVGGVEVAAVVADRVDALWLEDEVLEPQAAAMSGNAPNVVAPRAARTISVRRSNRGESSSLNLRPTSSSISSAPRAIAEARRPLRSISTALGVAVTPYAVATSPPRSSRTG